MLSYAQALNGTLALQANVNQTNTSYLLTTNVTYPYSLNDSLWSLNYSNMSIGWLYATNSTGADSFVANYSNFTTIYGWGVGNASLLNNYSTIGYGYAINSSDTDTFVANYSTYLLKPTYAQVTNGTILMRFQDWTRQTRLTSQTYPILESI